MTNKKKKSRLYLVYDYRAMEDTNKAIVMDSVYTLKDAVKGAKAQGGGVIFSYHINGKNLVDERFEKFIGEMG